MKVSGAGIGPEEVERRQLGLPPVPSASSPRPGCKGREWGWVCLEKSGLVFQQHRENHVLSLLSNGPHMGDLLSSQTRKTGMPPTGLG